MSLKKSRTQRKSFYTSERDEGKRGKLTTRKILYLTFCVDFDVDYLQCDHFFYNGEFTYSFSHMPKYINQWETLENRLKDVIDKYID
ncbi:hypothetical protein B9G39_00375 [Zooshikella ganghwensis]|uniref:Uncharacterized protein n=1 Tax=Zooshikella ganghwensis TaxID=202772 RepID=A0A4P9VFW7_9GAMM|nr:hypothetical protein B9G39_00375 [Zooshikella ganghwensis]